MLSSAYISFATQNLGSPNVQGLPHPFKPSALMDWQHSKTCIPRLLHWELRVLQQELGSSCGPILHHHDSWVDA